MAERQIPWWYRLEEDFAQRRAGGWFAINIANPIDRRLLRWSNGRIATFVGQPVGLRELSGAERDDSWEKVNHLYAGYDVYQGRTGGREIPVIALEAEPAATNAEPAAAETAGFEPR